MWITECASYLAYISNVRVAVDDATAFEEKLKNLCIVEEDYSNCTANVDTHVATQQCQDILS